MNSDSASPSPDGRPAGLSPTPEQRRLAALHFERGSALVASGDYKHGIRLLLECCTLDPANLLYRQAVRRAEKARFGNSGQGEWFAWLFAWPLRARLRRARAAGRYLDVLALGERILVRNPWDVSAQIEMSRASELLGLLDLAIWNLEQARQKAPYSPDLNRRLARLYERRGNFTQALALWERIRETAPDDEEASQKLATMTSGAAMSEDAFQHKLAQLHARRNEEPTRPAAYLDLARLYREADMLDVAKETLVEGLAATGNAFELSIELTDVQIEPFRRDLAITEQRLTQTPADEELQRIRAQLWREVNTRELDLFRTLADRYPSRLLYRYEVGLRLLQAGQLDEAVEELQAVRADAQLHGSAVLALAYGYRNRKNFLQALRHFQQALTLLPAEQIDRKKEVLYELAQCHADMNEYAKAVELGEELCRLDAGHRDVGRLMAGWQLRVGQAS